MRAVGHEVPYYSIAQSSRSTRLSTEIECHAKDTFDARNEGRAPLRASLSIVLLEVTNLA